MIINSSDQKYFAKFINDTLDLDFLIVRIYSIDNNELLHEYYQNKFCFDSFNKFIVIKNETWWIGCRNYQYKIFINCNTRKIYNDPDNQQISNFDNIFIWSGEYILSPLHNYIIIKGYLLDREYLYQLYDISKLNDNILVNISNTNLNLFNINTCFYKNDDEYLLFGDLEFTYNKILYNITYKFIYDNYIIIYIHDKYYTDIYGYYEIL